MACSDRSGEMRRLKPLRVQSDLLIRETLCHSIMQPLDFHLGLPLDLVIVGGAYKSGTSMLCEAIETRGYCNPGLLTNATEQGHGISAGMYLTRECSIARDWNRRLVTAGPREAAAIEKQLAGYLSEMTRALGPRLVLKDPYMKMTALHWFRAAHSMGIQRLTFLLTVRDLTDVTRSWANSRFLTWKQRVNPEQFRHLIAPLKPDVYRELSSLSVSFREVEYLDVVGINSLPVSTQAWRPK